jgi:hypothetical protein
VKPWLDDKPAPDVQLLTTLELLRVWTDNRNGMLGRCAADEVCKRLKRDEQINLKETT